MEREEKVEERGKKRVEENVFKGTKLLRGGILVRSGREGISTPSPTWDFGLVQKDGSLVQDFTLSAKTANFSARKLGANLWELQAYLEKGEMNRIVVSSRLLKDEKFEHEQPGQMKIGDHMKQKAATSSRVNRVDQAQATSPSSYCSSMEMAPYRHKATANGLESKGKFEESNYSLRTSTELIKVLNRIWSLEEKHSLNTALVKSLKKELNHYQARLKRLTEEKKRDQNEISELRKQIAKEQAAKELEKERKTRVLLEDLCDEFAKGIRDYEQEVRLLRQKSHEDQSKRETDGLILHISEAWLDERTQMRLRNGEDVVDKPSVADKLRFEIETFLQSKQDSKKKARESSGHSFESFHLNELASAPRNVNEDQDSVETGFHDSQLKRGPGLKQGEIGLDGNLEETSKSKPVKKKENARRVVKGSGLAGLQARLDEHDVSSSGNKHQLINEQAMKSSTDFHANSTRNPSNQEIARKDEQVKGLFDPSMFSGPSSPVEKWTSDIRIIDQNAPDSLSPSLKPNTLRAKLLEARLESQQLRSKSSKGLSYVE